MPWTRILGICTYVTLNLETWPWFKVMTHPWVMHNNCVKYYLELDGSKKLWPGQGLSVYVHCDLRDNRFVIEWAAGINCIILWSQIKFYRDANTIRIITILIHSDKTRFQNVFVTLLHRVAKDMRSLLLSWHKRYDFNAANFRRHSQWKCMLQT